MKEQLNKLDSIVNEIKEIRDSIATKQLFLNNHGGIDSEMIEETVLDLNNLERKLETKRVEMLRVNAQINYEVGLLNVQIR